jgi:hypothetical protein
LVGQAFSLRTVFNGFQPGPGRLKTGGKMESRPINGHVRTAAALFVAMAKPVTDMPTQEPQA